eukprot:3881297-Rhodomonas_salina.1
MELIQGMVRNRATIQIPDVGKFWPETDGSIRARVEGFRRFPGKRLGRQHEYYGFIISVVDSVMTEEIGSKIEIGLRAFGRNGVLETMRELTFEQACWREEEWIPIWNLGVNTDVQDKISPQVWKLLEAHPPSTTDLAPRPLCLGGSPGLLFAKPSSGSLHRCGLCRVSAAGGV